MLLSVCVPGVYRSVFRRRGKSAGLLIRWMDGLASISVRLQTPREEGVISLDMRPTLRSAGRHDTTARTHTRQPYVQSCHFPFPPSPDIYRTCPIGMVVFTSCIGIGGEGVCGVWCGRIRYLHMQPRQLAAKPSSGWHVWMICRCLTGPPCDSWPRPFRIYTRLWFSGPGANTLVPTRHIPTPAFWMLVVVISGMGKKFHTNHVVCIFPRKPPRRRARRGKADR